MGLDVNGVGNHEFDEGKAELLRMQYGNQNGGDGATRSTAARTARRSPARCSSSSPPT